MSDVADQDVLVSANEDKERGVTGALTLMREHGPDALSFGTLAKATGLSGATLVQRFGSKPALVKAASTGSWAAREPAIVGISMKTPRVT